MASSKVLEQGCESSPVLFCLERFTYYSQNVLGFVKIFLEPCGILWLYFGPGNIVPSSQRVHPRLLRRGRSKLRSHRMRGPKPLLPPRGSAPGRQTKDSPFLTVSIYVLPPPLTRERTFRQCAGRCVQTVEKLTRPKDSEGKIIGKKTVRVVFPIKSNKFQNFFKGFEICISLSKRSKRTFLTS